MSFNKYQHLERFGTDEVEGIEIGTVYVFPKLDGSNGSVWFDGEIKYASRNRELSLGSDNQGFMDTLSKDERFSDFFKEYPYLTLYGEWLVPHTLQTYRKDAWRKFYVFDVVSNGEYLHYNDYSVILHSFGIDYVPVLAICERLDSELILNIAKANTYLIKDNEGVGEGVVLKNYNYVNKYGRKTWAKYVLNEFKEKHNHKEPTHKKGEYSVEHKIVDEFVTEAFVLKEYNKIKNDGGWSSKMLPKLFGVLFHTLIMEECWNMIKAHKNPTIDFKKLNLLVINKTKEYLINYDIL